MTDMAWVSADPSILERFWCRVDASGDCWEWLAGKTKNGYGRFSPKRRAAVRRYRMRRDSA